MAFVDVAVAMGAEGLGATMLGGGMLGATVGGGISALTGRSVLNGALMGGLMGGAGAGIFGGLGGAGSAAGDVTGQIGTDITSMQSAGASTEQIATSLMQNYGMSAEQATAAIGQAANGTGTAAGIGALANDSAIQTASPAVAAGVAPESIAAAPSLVDSGTQYPAEYMGEYGGPQVGYSQEIPSNVSQGGNATTPSMFSGVTNFVKAHPYMTAAGVGAALLASQGKKAFQPNYLPTYNPQSASSMGLGRTLASNYRGYQPMAEGGITKLADGGLLQNGPAQVNFMGNDMYPQSQIQRSYYATPTQMPTSAQETMAGYEPKTNPLTGELTANMADGGITAAGVSGLKSVQQAQPVTMDYIQSLAGEYGVTLPTKSAAAGGSMGGNYNLGSYSDGGRLLKGPGDGMSDNIPATIADKQPARLADGEFVVSADVVSGLGNGSTDAGAKHLYKMMDNVRKARTGRKLQGKQIKADKYLPK